LTWPIFFKSTI
jgi:hypothetical protein